MFIKYYVSELIIQIFCYSKDNIYMKLHRIVYPESFTQRVLFLYLRSIPDYLVQQTKSGVTFLTNLFAGKNNKTP